MASTAEKRERFLALHVPGTPLLLPNAWDAGTARIFETMGFQATATTSAGHAATLGRLDGNVSLDEVVDHAAAIVAATDLPVSADFENGFADDPAAVAANVRRVAATGLAGVSVEDYTGRPDEPIYDLGLARDRVAAACEATGDDGPGVVITARAENFLRGNPDLDDTIARLQAYAAAGAGAVYAPGLASIDDIRRVVDAVDCPLNVLALPGVPPVAELAAAGVARISVGSGFSLLALSATAAAARELLEEGTYGFWGQVTEGAVVRDALQPR